MRSDVPVGAFLLNGIDSTAIVALAREVNPEIMTFSVGYDVDGPPEIDAAHETAQHLGVRTVSTRIGPHDMMAALPKIIWHLDDPLADPGVVSLYFVAKKAAEHVTVVLSGEGADELFGGYTVYRDPLRLSGVAGLPDPLQRGLRKIAHALPEGRKGKDFLERGLTPIEQRYFGNGRMFTEEEKRVLLRHYDEAVRYTDVTGPVYTEATAAGLDDVTKMQYIDLFTWLRGDILVKADRMSMAHSLEVRTPFLDRVVFDVAARVPVELKVPAKSETTKFAMRRAVESILPPALVAAEAGPLPGADPRLAALGDVRVGARHPEPAPVPGIWSTSPTRGACSTSTNAVTATCPGGSGRCSSSASGTRSSSRDRSIRASRVTRRPC